MVLVGCVMFYESSYNLARGFVGCLCLFTSLSLVSCGSLAILLVNIIIVGQLYRLFNVLYVRLRMTTLNKRT